MCAVKKNDNKNFSLWLQISCFVTNNFNIPTQDEQCFVQSRANGSNKLHGNTLEADKARHYLAI